MGPGTSILAIFLFFSLFKGTHIVFFMWLNYLKAAEFIGDGLWGLWREFKGENDSEPAF